MFIVLTGLLMSCVCVCVCVCVCIRSEGITYVRFQMVPCGVNLPHTHPRATEILTLITGGPLQVGFVDTSGF